jgi:hypothetical protein
MKPSIKCFSPHLLGWFILTLLFSHTTLAQEQSQMHDNNIFLPFIQQNSGTTEQNVQEQPFVTIQGTVEQVVSEYSPDQVIISLATVYVKEVIEGNLSTERLVIHYEGGTVGEITLRVSHQPMLTAGMDLRAKLYRQSNGEYAIYDLDKDLTVFNPEVFASFVLQPYHWPDSKLPIPIRINPSNSDIADADEAGAVRNAINTWNSFTGSFFEFVDVGNSTCLAHEDSTDGYFCVEWLDNRSNGRALATTYSWYNNDQLTEIDIIFWGKAVDGTDYIWSTRFC